RRGSRGQFAIRIDAHRPVRVDPDVLAMQHVDAGPLPVAPRAHRGNESYQLPNALRLEAVEIQARIIDGGVLCNGQPAPVVAPVADGDLDRPEPMMFPVAGDARPKGPARLQGVDRADRIAEHTPAPL